MLPKHAVCCFTSVMGLNNVVTSASILGRKHVLSVALRQLPAFLFVPVTGKDLSESETDSDVLFESKTKTTSFATRVVNGEPPNTGWKKNGHYKGSRKVKT